MVGRSILIVDDEAPIREMIAVALEMAGYDCLEAENSQQAHAIIVDRKPDLILLDWMLPGTSGIELARRLKRDELTAGIEDPADVHYVQTKTPLLTQASIADAHSRGKTVVTEDTLKSMDISNSTTALGIGERAGNTEMDQLLVNLKLAGIISNVLPQLAPPSYFGTRCMCRCGSLSEYAP